MKYKVFTVSFFEGFKKVGSSTAISTVEGGVTIQEMMSYCKTKFPGQTIKVEV